jgi:serine protease AprX
MHRLTPVRRSLIAAVCALLGTVVFALAAAGAASGDDKKQGLRGNAESPKVDRNRNKLFDDLEARLAEASAREHVNVIVTLKAEATAGRVAALSNGVGGFNVGKRIDVIDGFSATVTKAEAEALANLPVVRRVEENSVVRALNDTAQASFGVTKARADAPALDGDGDGNPDAYAPADLVAAVIDTGIDASHVDLDEGKVIAFKDFVNGRTEPYDDQGHGTHVAGTIAGDGDSRADGLHRGVAHGAGLVGVKVLDANGSGTMANIAAAIDWVVENKDVYGIEAVNLSLGAAGCSDGTDASSLAVNNAGAAGLVVAVAAGNEGPGTCTIGTPGAASGAVTVGAMADSGALGFSQASFSSRGGTVDGRIKPDISAPGVDITSAAANTGTGYAQVSGTSMATPFVAGVALLMRDTDPSLTPQQVRQALTSTAIDWGRGGNNRTAGSSGPDVDYGAGRLDAYAALKASGAPISTPPAAPEHRLYEGSLSGTGAVADYKLNVTDVGFPIAATLIMPGVLGATAWSPDFDLYLYDPAGRLVALAETVQRQEAIGFKPTTTGTYTLRVGSFSGSGGYFVDVSAGLGALPAPPPQQPTTVTASPASVSLYYGSVRSGGAARLGADDNAFFEVNSTTSGTRASDWYGRITGVTNALQSLKITYRGRSYRTCTQVVYVYNWTTGAWVQLDSRSVSTSEVEVNASPTGTLADYVSGSSGDGEVAVRIRCSRSDGSFYTSADLLRITYQR